MKRSLNEIQAMALKAARGAGVPLGHAEDFAAAVVYLAATSPDKLDQVSPALAPPHDVARLENGNTLASARVAMAGPLAVDLICCGDHKIILQEVDAPALLHAFFAVAHHRLGIEGAVMHNGASVTIVQDTGIEYLRPRSGAVDVPDTIWAAWDAYAQQTYVPASEASRLAGAGAGLTDND